ncbi:sensor histidine kinase [Streptomyces sp. NPDC004726]
MAAVILTGGLTRDWPAGPRSAAVAVLFVSSILVIGLLRPVRARGVRLANSLLGTALPSPVTGPGPGRPDRWRGAAWLLLHSVLGWLVTAVGGLLAATAATMTAVWLGGGDRVQLLTVTADVRAGWRGSWAVLLAIASLVAAAATAAAATALFRRLAPVLLGPGRAERVAALEERMRVLAESNRLAQELHDSIGHTLTASTIQAAVASELMETDPESARRALSSIEEASRSALDDLDRVLGVLRQGGAAAPAAVRLPSSGHPTPADAFPSTVHRSMPADAPSAEAPGPATRLPTLAGLPALLERVRRAGTELRADIVGDTDRVPAAVSRETYRIIQEGLTNALRHARQEPVTLRLTVTGDWLEAELTNPIPDGTGRVTDGHDPGRSGREGYGLTGVGERVRLLNGELTAGPAPDGRWRLAARIPLRSSP